MKIYDLRILLTLLFLNFPFSLLGQENSQEKIQQAPELSKLVTIPFSEALKIVEGQELIAEDFISQVPCGPVLHYELVYSQVNDFPLSDSIGLIRNFHDDIVTTGEVGLYRNFQNLVIPKGFNLSAAYRWAIDNLDPLHRPLTFDDIYHLRTLALNTLYFKSQIKVKKPTNFKEEKEFTFILDKINDEVLQKLADYKISVKKYDSKKSVPFAYKTKLRQFSQSHKEPLTDIYTLHMPDPLQTQANLRKYLDNLNSMIHSGESPKNIVTFMVQDLLIIHPFQDGNGRLSRLLGQVYYKLMTGKTVIFSKKFHNELSYSAAQLSEELE